MTEAREASESCMFRSAMRLRRHDERKGFAFPKVTKNTGGSASIGRHSLGLLWAGDGEPEAHRSSWRQSRTDLNLAHVGLTAPGLYARAVYDG